MPNVLLVFIYFSSRLIWGEDHRHLCFCLLSTSPWCLISLPVSFGSLLPPSAITNFYWGSSILSPKSQKLFPAGGISFHLHNKAEVGGAALILQMRKARFREVKWHTEDLSKEQNLTCYSIPEASIVSFLSSPCWLLRVYGQQFVNVLMPQWKSAWTRSPWFCTCHAFSTQGRSEECDSYKPGPSDALLPQSSQALRL